MANILKGAPVAKNINDSIKISDTVPVLGLVRVGENPEDISYEKSLIKSATAVGIKTVCIAFPSTASKEDVVSEIERINNDDGIHGCMIFRPILNPDIDEAACKVLSYKKDVDGITMQNMAALYEGKNCIPPATAKACMEFLKYYDIPVSGKKITVVGRSMVIGKPLSMLLLKENATIKICHSKTENLKEECRDSDILIACAGSANLIDKDYVSPGQTVVDIGINFTETGKIVGDVDFASVSPIVANINPALGGIGVITSAVVLRTTYHMAGY